MTLKEKVIKFEFMDEVWVVVGDKINNGCYVGYCGCSDEYSVLFDYGYDNEHDVHQYQLSEVFKNKEDAERELAQRNINTLQRQINAIKKEYNL